MSKRRRLTTPDTLDHLREQNANQLVQSSSKAENDQLLAEKLISKNSADGIVKMFENCEEDLQNATSITYPPHLAQSAMTNILELVSDSRMKEIISTKENVVTGHMLAKTLSASASAAYTASIQNYEEVNEQCKKIIQVAKAAFSEEDPNERSGKMEILKKDCEKLNGLLISLPLQTDIDKSSRRRDYEKFGNEHVQALTKLANLQKDLETSEKLKMDKDAEIVALNRKIEESQREIARTMTKAEGDASAVDEMRTQLAKSDVELEEMRRRSISPASTSLFNSIPPPITSFQFYWEYKSKVLLSQNQPINQPALLVDSILEWTEMANSEKLRFERLEDLEKETFLDRVRLAFLQDQLYRTLDPVRCEFAIQSNEGSANSGKHHNERLKNDIIDQEIIACNYEEERQRMDEVIRRAVQEIENIQKRARENSDGIRLEVNESILERCQQLISAIMQLVVASRELQTEIVETGKAEISSSEFYRRNHQWTEGLLSAAKAVEVAARVLVESADAVVNGNSDFENIIVASRDITSSADKFFVSILLKADKNSENYKALSVAWDGVNRNTAQVVAAVKHGKSILDDKESFDFSHLSLGEARKRGMDSQLRMLELEQQLNNERAKLAALRKQHYHMAHIIEEEESQ